MTFHLPSLRFAACASVILLLGACGAIDDDYTEVRLDPREAPIADAGLLRSDALVSQEFVTTTDAGSLKCLDDSECASGYCVKRTCCDRPCQGLCESCRVPGQLGTCALVPAGQDFGGHCEVDGDDECAGRCDGKGGCTFPGATKTCGAKTCAAGERKSGACDAEGSCAMQKESCGGLACANAYYCMTTCFKDEDCLGTDMICVSGACVVAKPASKP